MEHYIVNRKVKNEKQAFAKINQLAFALAKITSENFRACRQLIYYSLGFVYRADANGNKCLIQTREGLKHVRKIFDMTSIEINQLQRKAKEIDDKETWAKIFPLVNDTFKARIKECAPQKKATTKRKTYNAKEIQSIVDLKVQEALANLEGAK